MKRLPCTSKSCARNRGQLPWPAGRLQTCQSRCLQLLQTHQLASLGCSAVFPCAHACTPLGTSLFRLWGHDLSSEQSNEFNHSLWHEVFRPINSVKVLHVADGLIREVTHFLQASENNYSRNYRKNSQSHDPRNQGAKYEKCSIGSHDHRTMRI